MAAQGISPIHFLYLEEYNTLKSLVIESLTLSFDDFEQLLPSKMRYESILIM